MCPLRRLGRILALNGYRRFLVLTLVCLLLASHAGEGLQAEEAGTSSPRVKRAGTSAWQKIAWISLGVGVCGGIGAIEFHKRANQAYNAYREARTEEDATRYRGETQTKDMLVNGLLAASVAGFLLSGFAFIKEKTLRSNDISLHLEISSPADVALVCKKSF